MADPVVHITAGIPDSGTGNITTLGQTLLDGANATLGVTTGAAVTTDAAGTLQQYLRGLVTLFNTGAVSEQQTTAAGVTPSGLFGVQGDPTNGLPIPVKTTALGGPLAVATEGQKATYSASIVGLVPATAATDIFTIIGSSTKTIRITRLQISGIATAATAADLIVLKRSTADTSGTSTAPAAIPHDNLNSAATALLKAYTVNPTLGTLVGGAGNAFRATKLALGTATAPGTPIVFDFSNNNSQGIVLRAATDQLALNWAAQTITGNSVNVDIQWTEE